ncbi:citryl-CoA lyase [Candidatus Woesearchaeota archaeon]|nr:MAG: citryl-CoA lyase [Candidatus Woesearchaeota archaeon]
MKCKTAVSHLTDDDLVIRGEKLSSLVAEASFTDAVFLILSGRKPAAKESRLFASILTSIIDHGTGTASALTSRFVASTGNALNASVAAGVLALGEYHGGAIETAMRQLADVKDAKAFVAEALKEKRRIMGFGHKVYKDEDPRVTQLYGIAEEVGYESPYLTLARDIERELAVQKGKKLVLNIDGFIAAALLGMGFPPEVGKGVFIIGRVPGLVAHAVEERQREKPVRRLDEADIEYDGK